MNGFRERDFTMREQVKSSQAYIVVGIDHPLIENIYEILKCGEMEKGDWRKGDISFEQWNNPKVEYLIINFDEPYAEDIRIELEAWQRDNQSVSDPGDHDLLYI